MLKEWQNRTLQDVYVIAFLDAIHFKVRQDGQIVNKAAYMVVGVDLVFASLFFKQGKRVMSIIGSSVRFASYMSIS